MTELMTARGATFLLMLCPLFLRGNNPVDSLEALLREHSDNPQKIEILNKLCGLLLYSDNEKAHQYCRQSLALAEKISDERGLAEALHCMGNAYYASEKKDEAVNYYQKSLETFRSIDDHPGMVKNLEYMAGVLQEKREYEGSFNLLNEALKISEKSDDENTKASILFRIGSLYREQSKLDEAMQYYLKTLTIKETLGKNEDIASISNEIGRLYKTQGRYDKALQYYLNSLKIRESLGEVTAKLLMLNNIGNVYWYLEDYDEALKYYLESLKIAKETGDSAIIAKSLNNIAGVYENKGDYQKALENFSESLRIMQRLGSKKIIAAVLANVGEIYLKLEQPDTAYEYASRALTMRETLGDKEEIARSLLSIGKIHFTRVEIDKSIPLLEKSLQLAAEVGAREVMKENYKYLSDAMKEKGHYKKAYEYYLLYDSVKDSINNFSVSKKINELQTKSEFEKKEAEIELFRKDVEIRDLRLNRQRNMIISSVGILVLLLFLSLSVYWGKKKSDHLLLNILPAETAKELKKHGKAKARKYDCATVLFTDFKGFTRIAEKLTPEELVAEIDYCFSEFDKIVGKYKVEKIKTIGDAYMCAGGLPTPNNTNPQDVVNTGLDMQNFIAGLNKTRQENGGVQLDVRIGIHTGPVIAGIVGKKKFAYDIWGDAVNIASRMESSGEPGKVNISGDTYELVKDKFHCVHRGKVEAKNKGLIDMYFVEKSKSVSA